MMLLGDKMAEKLANEGTMEVAKRLYHIQSLRYLYCGTFKKRSNARINTIGDWRRALDNVDYLSDEAFLLYFQMNRGSFQDLLILLGSNSHFDSPGKRQQPPLGLHTM